MFQRDVYAVVQVHWMRNMEVGKHKIVEVGSEKLVTLFHQV